MPHSPRTAELGLWIPLPLLPFLPMRDKDPSLKKLSLSLKHNPKLVESSTFAFFSVSLAALGGHLESSPSLWGGQDPASVLLGSLRTLSTRCPRDLLPAWGLDPPGGWPMGEAAGSSSPERGAGRAPRGWGSLRERGPMVPASTHVTGLHIYVTHM